MDHLYIIGNGFDVKHGIRSRYVDFCLWLETHNPELLRKMNLTYNITGPEWWSQFEQKLAEIPFDSIVSRSYDEASAMEIFGFAPFEKVGVINDVVQEVGYDISHFMLDLQCAFWEFIHSIDVTAVKPLVTFPERDAAFLNFNYTDTLEEAYHIEANNIFHIHGCVNNLESDFVFGHGKSYDELYARLSNEAKRSNLYVVDDEFEKAEIITDASNQLSVARKRTEEIIEKNQSFFNGLSTVRSVISMGFSFSEVDMPYLDLIVQNVYSHAIWKFGCHTQTDRDRIEFFVRSRCLNKVEYFKF